MSPGISRYIEARSQVWTLEGSILVLCFQVVLSSLGGVQLLYPLLEQVDLPIKQREEKEGGEESKSNRKEEEENKRTTTPSAHRETNSKNLSEVVRRELF